MIIYVSKITQTMWLVGYPTNIKMLSNVTEVCLQRALNVQFSSKDV